MSKKFKNIFISGLILFVIIPLSLIFVTIAYINREDMTISSENDVEPKGTEKIIYKEKVVTDTVYVTKTQVCNKKHCDDIHQPSVPEPTKVVVSDSAQ
jgi:hypothetical protein